MEKVKYSFQTYFAPAFCRVGEISETMQRIGDLERRAAEYDRESGGDDARRAVIEALYQNQEIDPVFDVMYQRADAALKHLEQEGYVTLDAALKILGVSRTTFYTGMREKIYPRPERIPGYKSGCWKRGEILRCKEQDSQETGKRGRPRSGAKEEA